jgi:phenylacetic acid degradation operon negative regulatory protein
LGGNPQHLLVTLLGDFWAHSSDPLPSSGLMALLADFGVTAQSGRSSLSRLATRGVLVVSKTGRRTYYRLSDETREAGQAILAEILKWGRGAAPAPAQERWTLVAVSVPDNDRRRTIRSALRRNGFMVLQDGLWVSHHRPNSSLLDDLGQDHRGHVSIFDATLAYPSHLPAPSVGSHLAEVRAKYESFINQFEPTSAVPVEDLSPSEALVLRETAMDQWRAIFHHDPQLPQELLPGDWPLTRAAHVFASVYDQLGPAAEGRCRAIMERAGLPTSNAPHHVSTDQS